MADGGGSRKDAFELFERTTLPDEVAVLRALYPREVWPDHRNLGAMASFWLERHAMFRDLGAALASGTAEFRDGHLEANGFLRWFAPRINMFLNELHGHHAVEDHHYFPVFRAADARLVRGFEILDADHHLIDALIHEIADRGQALYTALQARGDAGRASDALCTTLDRTLKGLLQHLGDEEEMVIPLILDRTEAKLGI
ncbi:hemerythrin domain-containing protein [Acuticoccus kandeliae]|uniref:hemerythrin domain-containing protein n=1 Tax=Acuticoccus kandeliae TaxID=2073160 RepID=UPI000D3E8AB3|nr:hemerythrin domain-containing protein [Acuticoccus kandeliae]